MSCSFNVTMPILNENVISIILSVYLLWNNFTVLKSYIVFIILLLQASIAHATKMLPVTDAILVITADTSYKLPFDAKVFYDKKRKRKHKLRKKYRQRRELYQQLETVMYLWVLHSSPFCMLKFILNFCQPWAYCINNLTDSC